MKILQMRYEPTPHALHFPDVISPCSFCMIQLGWPSKEECTPAPIVNVTCWLIPSCAHVLRNFRSQMMTMTFLQTTKILNTMAIVCDELNKCLLSFIKGFESILPLSALTFLLLNIRHIQCGCNPLTGVKVSCTISLHQANRRIWIDALLKVSVLK